jgi:hypothetical protein
MAETGSREKGLLRRLWSVFRGGGPSEPVPGGAPARWPHLRRGWLDPEVPLAGWRSTVDTGDVEEVLRAAAAASGGRLANAEVAEVLDALAGIPDDRSPAFRFGEPGVGGHDPIWLGFARASPDAVKVFALGDTAFVERLGESLSVARYAGPGRREEYERLRRFFVAAYLWEAFVAAGGAAPAPGRDAASTAERMDRILSDPRAPFLEALRGLRRRTLDVLEDTRGLDAASVERMDAFLAGRGAPTLGEMRRRYWNSPPPR